MVSKYKELEDRTFQFAQNIKFFCRDLPKNTSNFEYYKQLIRSSGSVAANYIEANEALGDKDFLMRVRISKKEAKESILWLKLVDCNIEKEAIRKNLIDEAPQLIRIFAAIITKRSKIL